MASSWRPTTTELTEAQADAAPLVALTPDGWSGLGLAEETARGVRADGCVLDGCGQDPFGLV